MLAFLLSLRRIIAIFNRLLKICIFVSNVCTGNKYDADESVHSQRPGTIAIGLGLQPIGPNKVSERAPLIKRPERIPQIAYIQMRPTLDAGHAY